MKILTPLLLLALLAGGAPGQFVISLDTALPGGIYDQHTTVSPAYPPGASIPFPPPWPGPTGILAPTPYPFGGVAIDNTTGIIYGCDGFTIEPLNFPFYAPLAPIPAPSYPYVGPIGPVHGMTLDPTAMPGGVLWVTDGFLVTGVGPGPGNPVFVPPFPVVGPVPVLAPPLTGLDWDPYTGSFWAVDTIGTVYNFLPPPVPGGPAIPGLPPIPAPPPAPGQTAAGLALDKTMPPTPPGVPVGIYVSFPGIIWEYVSNSPVPPGAGPFAVGLTFHGWPAPLTGGVSCLGLAPPTFRCNSAAWSGNFAFSFDLTGVTAGAPLVLALDFAGPILPAGLPFVGGILYVDPILSTTAAFLPFGVMPAGTFSIPVNLVGVPPGGAHVYVQMIAVECPAPPLYSLSDALQFIVSLP